MAIIRVVQVQFKKDAPTSAVTDTLKEVYAMKENCLHAETKKPYIQWIRVGKDQSPEPLNNDFTHQFVMEFANAADRDYYSAKDPAHQGVIASLGPIIEKVQIVDIVDGEL